MKKTFLFVNLLASFSVAHARVMQGMYAYEPPSGPAGIDAREVWLGKPVEVMESFTSSDVWSNGKLPGWQMTPLATWLHAKPNRTILSTLAMLPDSDPNATLEACAAGTYNHFWAEYATILMDFNLGGIIIRPGHEFTGNWSRWYAVGREATYAKCFKQVVTTMRATEPTGNWKFDWNPTTSATPAILSAAYPGDAYVDYITTDFYDTAQTDGTYPYPAGCDQACRLVRQKRNWVVQKSLIDRITSFAKSKNKPMAISEWGVWDESAAYGGGDNPYYIEQMHNYINDPLNNLAYQIYFDVRASDGNHRLFSTTATPTLFPLSAAKYRELFGAQAATMQLSTAPTLSSSSIKVGDSFSVSAGIKDFIAGGEAVTAYLYLRSSDGKTISAVQSKTLAAGVAMPLTWPVKIPATAISGNYDLSIKVFNAATGVQLLDRYNILSMDVLKANPITSVSSLAISATSIKFGQTLHVNGKATSNQSGDLMVFAQITDSTGKLVATVCKQVMFTANSAASFDLSLSMAASIATVGSYKINVGVGSTNWASRYTYQVGALSFKVVP